MDEISDQQLRQALVAAGVSMEYMMSLVRRAGHGTRTGYGRGCRCYFCRAANAQSHREGTRRRTTRGLPPEDPRHGTDGGYGNWGCRCDSCLAAHSTRCREYAQRRKGSTDAD